MLPPRSFGSLDDESRAEQSASGRRISKYFIRTRLPQQTRVTMHLVDSDGFLDSLAPPPVHDSRAFRTGRALRLSKGVSGIPGLRVLRFSPSEGLSAARRVGLRAADVPDGSIQSRPPCQSGL